MKRIKTLFLSCKRRLQSWFRRCNGPDELGLAIIVASLILHVLNAFLRSDVLAVMGSALFLWTVFRLLSHNKAKRMEENRRFRQLRMKLNTQIRQGLVRIKNMRKYKYYRCPNCKARLRIPRGAGEKTVRCSQCQHTFRQKG